MLTRLGHVVNWAGCILAAMALALGAATASSGTSWDWEAALPVLLLAPLIWAAGRAGRYVLSGD